MADRDRLLRALGGPDADWLLARLAERVARGVPLSGRLAIKNPDAAQREVVARLTGDRRPSGHSSLSIDLAQLERTLVEAGMCRDLQEAVEVLKGPVPVRAEIRDAEKVAWDRVFAEARAGIALDTAQDAWLEQLRASGLVRKLAAGDPEAGAALLGAAVSIVVRLPAGGLLLARLAAEAVGNSHALDRGEPVGTLVFRHVAALGGLSAPRGADGWREAWERVGVACDELSAPVLAIGLRPVSDDPQSLALRCFADAGEPCRLSIRHLSRTSPRFAAGGTAFVCENPAVVAAAADRLGAACPPLICVEGQPKTAAHLLLGLLTAAGWELWYHGDFDWKGVEIGNFVMLRHGARPWRMATEDYLGVRGGTTLEGPPVEASWDPHLASAMATRGQAIHEEVVLEALIGDLARLEAGRSYWLRGKPGLE